MRQGMRVDKELTWGELKKFLSKITDEAVLNTPVRVREHHHFTWMKVSPVIETFESLAEDCVEGDAVELKELLEEWHNSKDENYKMYHPKQPFFDLIDNGEGDDTCQWT